MMCANNIGRIDAPPALTLQLELLPATTMPLLLPPTAALRCGRSFGLEMAALKRSPALVADSSENAVLAPA
jgi:hypothetical protein